MNKISRPPLWLLILLSAFFISCKKPGTAMILLESCVDGRLYYKNITDTSEVWAEVSADAQIEADSEEFNPKFSNFPELYRWVENSDTTIWVDFSDDSLMMLNHVHMDSSFQRFYGKWYVNGRTVRYSISHPIRRLALDRIRNIQAKYPDSIRPANSPGNIYAKDSCQSRWERVHGSKMVTIDDGEIAD